MESNTNRMITYGLLDNHLVHIDKVPNGIDCNCICPACHDRLVAKNGGTERLHHFAHQRGVDCKYGYQTQIHLLAKELLQKGSQIHVPAKKLYNVKITDKNIFFYHSVILEKKLHNIIPDVILLSDFGKLIIEIKVAHGIDHDKYEKIKEIDIDTLEIDLSMYHHEEINQKKLEDFIFNHIGHKKWIYFKKQEHYRQMLIDQSVIKEINNVKNQNYILECPLTSFENPALYTRVSKCLQCSFFVEKVYRNHEYEKEYYAIRCLGHLKIDHIKDINQKILHYQKQKQNKVINITKEYYTLSQLWEINGKKPFIAINKNGKKFEIEEDPLPYIAQGKPLFANMITKNGKFRCQVYYMNYSQWKTSL